jgi:hypothetical protein
MASAFTKLPAAQKPKRPLTAVCGARLSADELQERTGFPLDPVPENGLGPAKGFLGQTETGDEFGFEWLEYVNETLIYLDESSPNLGRLCRDLFQWLRLGPGDVKWSIDDPKKGGFTVWRVDDNANVIPVSSHTNRAAAAYTVAEFEARGHKQHYWYATGN